MIRLFAATAALMLAATPVIAEDAPTTATAASKTAADAVTKPDPSSPAKSLMSTVKKDIATPAQPPAKEFTYKPKESDVVTGKEDAPVVIVEYASLSCPHCAHFFANVLPSLTAKYIDTGKVKMVYRNYPLNDPALKAAELVQCAPPERRHAFIKVLFATQMKWAYDISSYRDALGNIAVLGGMDRLKFESCMTSKPVEKIVLEVAKEANDDYHVNSTPTFYIDGAPLKGDLDVALGQQNGR